MSATVQPSGTKEHVRDRLGARAVFVGLAAALAVTLIAPVVLFAGTTLGTIDSDLAARTAADRARATALAARLVDQEIDAIEADLRLLSSLPDIQQGNRLRDPATMESALAGLVASGRYSYAGVYDDTSRVALAAAALDRGTVLLGSRTSAVRQAVGVFAGETGQQPPSEALYRQVITGALSQGQSTVTSSAFPALTFAPAAGSIAAEPERRYAVFVGRPIIGERSLQASAASTVGALVVAPRFDRLSERLRALAAPGRTVALLTRDAASGSILVVLASTAPVQAALLADLTGHAFGGLAGELRARAPTERIVAYEPIDARSPGAGANWLVTVTDELAITLGPERRLGEQIQAASATAVVLAGLLAGALAFLLGQVERQRRALAGSLAQNVRLLAEIQVQRGELQVASEAKSRFLASMSHELRTPLNSIIGFSELMQTGVAGTVNEKQREYLGDVVGSARHLLGLINEILDLSKVEAGKVELHPEDVDVALMIEQVAAMIRPLAEAKTLHLAVDIADDLGSAHHDPSRLRQVLLNLASNAVKFTPAGGRVTLGARRLDERFEMFVSDSGIGLSEADLGRIFEEFRQVDSPYTRSQQGTGLGLALVKRFVELMGGTIAVSSTLGVGSIFTIRLPLRQGSAAPASAVSA